MMTREEVERFRIQCMLEGARDRKIYRLAMGRFEVTRWLSADDAHRDPGFLETLIDVGVMGMIQYETDEHARLIYILPTQSGLDFIEKCAK